MRASPAAPSLRRAAGGRRVGQVLFGSLYRVRVHGAEHIPSCGGAIVAGNHTALLDGPLLFSVLPRPMHLLVKEELFHGPVGLVLRACGQIPVRRRSVDRAAIEAALQVLARGDLLGMFPEGTRGSGDFATVELGLAHLALTARVPVVPAAVFGVRRPGGGVNALPRLGSRLEVVLGAPVLVGRGSGPRRTRLSAASDELRERLAEHVREAGAALGRASQVGQAGPSGPTG